MQLIQVAFEGDGFVVFGGVFEVGEVEVFSDDGVVVFFDDGAAGAGEPVRGEFPVWVWFVVDVQGDISCPVFVVFSISDGSRCVVGVGSLVLWEGLVCEFLFVGCICFVGFGFRAKEPKK